MNDEVAIVAGGSELLVPVEPLWRELREHHAAMSPAWRDALLAARFEDRRAELIAKSAGGIRVLLAVTVEVIVGYCVVTVDADGRGEVDSLYIAPSHRGRGIGRRLMQDGLNWLSNRASGSLTVNTLAGNDEAVSFYASFGFVPRTLTCQQVSGLTNDQPPR